MANAAAHTPDTRTECALIQKMMPGGHEFVIGIVRDPDFGPLLVSIWRC